MAATHLQRALKRLQKLQDDTSNVAPYAAMIDVGYFLTRDLSHVIDDLLTAQQILDQTKNAHGGGRGR
ncbi:hypothetical protein D3C87_1731170 [compost metagenome]